MPSTEVGEADPSLLVILLGAIVGVLAVAAVGVVVALVVGGLRG